MNVLFEKYVARLLTRALAGTGLRASTQGGQRDCLYESNTGRFRTRPDLIIRDNDQIVLIIDTKWKRITPRIDDPKQGVSQSDVYQMMAYGQLYHCPSIMLLYPHHNGLPENPILQHYSVASVGAEEKLSLATIDVSGSAVGHRKALIGLVESCLNKVPL